MNRKTLNNSQRKELSPSKMSRQRNGQISRRRYQERKRRHRRKMLRNALGMLSILFLIAAITLVAILWRLHSEEQREIRVQQSLQEMYATLPAETQAPNDAQEMLIVPELPSVNDALPSVLDVEKQEYSALPSVSDVERWIAPRLRQLYQTNSDLIGWLELSDIVNAPVVLRDNEYYLSHDFYGASSSSGTVFADEKNMDWENSSFMLLYGHNMREGIMFGQLNELKKLSGFCNSTLLRFNTLYDETPRYFVPFAVVDAAVNVDAEDYFYLRRFDIFNGESRNDEKIADFIAEMRSRSIVEIPDFEVTPSDNILGLVTCSYSSDNARLMVFFREVRVGEEPTVVSARVSASAQIAG